MGASSSAARQGAAAWRQNGAGLRERGAMNDAQETLARIQAQLKLIEDPDGKDPETLEAEKEEKEALIKELEEKLEVAVLKIFAPDAPLWGEIAVRYLQLARVHLKNGHLFRAIVALLKFAVVGTGHPLQLTKALKKAFREREILRRLA